MPLFDRIGRHRGLTSPGTLSHVENPPDTFSPTEVQHLLDVVADQEGRYPEPMRAFAAVLLELLAAERPELLRVGMQVH